MIGVPVRFHVDRLSLKLRRHNAESLHSRKVRLQTLQCKATAAISLKRRASPKAVQFEVQTTDIRERFSQSDSEADTVGRLHHAAILIKSG